MTEALKEEVKKQVSELEKERIQIFKEQQVWAGRIQQAEKMLEESRGNVNRYVGRIEQISMIIDRLKKQVGEDPAKKQEKPDGHTDQPAP